MCNNFCGQVLFLLLPAQLGSESTAACAAADRRVIPIALSFLLFCSLGTSDNERRPPPPPLAAHCPLMVWAWAFPRTEGGTGGDMQRTNEPPMEGGGPRNEERGSRAAQHQAVVTFSNSSSSLFFPFPLPQSAATSQRPLIRGGGRCISVLILRRRRHRRVRRPTDGAVFFMAGRRTQTNPDNGVL